MNEEFESIIAYSYFEVDPQKVRDSVALYNMELNEGTRPSCSHGQLTPIEVQTGSEDEIQAQLLDFWYQDE